MKKLITLLALVSLVFAGCGAGSGSGDPNDTTTKALISTSLGDITIKLYDETPLHRDNFIKLANEGFYDGTIFHRVIKNFMIQGGDPDSKNAAPGQPLGRGSTGYTIPAEFVPELFHKKGALAAARKGAGNPQKESSGCQFYIVTGKVDSEEQLAKMPNMTDERRAVYKEIGGTPFLDDNYTVFGEVVSGLDIVDKIGTVQTQQGDRPIEDIKMTIKIIK